MKWNVMIWPQPYKQKKPQGWCVSGCWVLSSVCSLSVPLPMAILIPHLCHLFFNNLKLYPEVSILWAHFSPLWAFLDTVYRKKHRGTEQRVWWEVVSTFREMCFQSFSWLETTCIKERIVKAFNQRCLFKSSFSAAEESPVWVKVSSCVDMQLIESGWAILLLEVLAENRLSIKGRHLLKTQHLNKCKAQLICILSRCGDAL